jgi:pimeloyl-ACP methyl ester carboxylesterase
VTLLDVSGADLDDLRERLRRTRWARSWPESAAPAGTDPARLRRLVERWAGDYDWRRHEAEINALPSHVVEIDGADVHYLRFDAAGRGRLPVILTHGWPSSVLELVELARRLAAAGHTAIVPSLPGFGFSAQRPALLEGPQTHELWHRLMHDVLGFDRFAAHGGDLGAGISARLGEAFPGEVAGIHVLAVAGPPAYAQESLTPAERDFLAAQAAWTEEEGGYQHEQMTRPLTLAAGLADSPAGLLAWLDEKYQAWSDQPPDDEFVLTQASVYWFTGTIATSFRPYFEYARHATRRVEKVTVPTAVAVFPKDLAHPPRSWAERTYHVVRWTEMPRGGHFAALEAPDLLAADIRAFLDEL